MAVALLRVPIPDTAIPLYLASRLLDGERVYSTYLEINPPLFVWLSVPGALLAKATGLSAWSANTALVGGLMLGSLRLCAELGRHTPWAPPWLGLPLLAFAFGVFPAQEFSNREHLALVMVTPFLLLSAARFEGRGVPQGLAAVCGAVGALGLAYKPYFLLAWVLVECALAWQLGRRWLLRPEALALIALGALYGVSILTVTPAYLAAALDWAPLYARYLRNSGIAILFPVWWSILPVAAATAVLALATKRRLGPAPFILLLASLGFWGGAVLQMKGLGYHYLTAGGLGFLVLALAGAGPGLGGVRRPSDLVLWLARATALVVVVWSLVVLLEEGAGRRPASHLDPRYQGLKTAVRELADSKPILVFSSNPAAGWPLTLEAGARWGSRFMSQWPLAGLYRDQLGQGPGVIRARPFPLRDGIERTFHEAMIADLLRYRPAAIVVLSVDSTERGFGGATRIDYLDYFGSDPRFVRLFAGYEEVGAFGRYRLFRRRGGPD